MQHISLLERIYSLTLPTIICLTLPIIIGSSGTGDKITKLHPNYVTGFYDGEATFLITIVKRSANKLG